MPSPASDESLSRAVFQSVTDGAYPDDEQIVTADLSSSAVNSLSQLLEQAREEVKTIIRELSRLSAQDIDGWITQARQLREDIDGSEKEAAEIVALAEKGKEFQIKEQEADEKVQFLRTEVGFSETLVNTLQQIHDVKQTVNAAQEAVIGGRLEEGTNLLHKSRAQLGSLKGCENTRLTGLLDAKLADVEATLAESATKHWKALVRSDQEQRKITIEKNHDGVSLETVVAVLDKLDLLKAKIIGLQRDLDSIVLKPRLFARPSGNIAIESNSIQISEQKAPMSTDALLNDLESFFGYITSNLPTAVVQPLAGIIMPSLISRLLGGPLASSVPPDLSGLAGFESTLARVQGFAETLDDRDWPGADALFKWANDAPNVWLARRSDTSLHSIRQLLSRGLGKPRSVERVETQTVAHDDEVFQGNGDSGDWDASWSDNGDGKSASAAKEVAAPDPANKDNQNQEEDDSDAWGWNDEEGNEDDDKTGETKNDDEKKTDDDADEGDAWGWGDDNEQKQPSPASPKKSPTKLKAAPSNGSKPGVPAAREITLRESYYITSLPEQILEIIVEAVDDADNLGKADRSANPVTPAAAGLLRLPNLLLAMYRASAPTFYHRDINGNMYLYNDCLYLAEQIRKFADHHATRSTSPSSLSSTGLDAETAALEFFGKAAYRKEMESQRTILIDVLDGAQDFKQCTEPPYAELCENAIDGTIDRLREVHAQFRDVLSPSALRQSIGSLLSTVTSKMIISITDMPDISEPQSQKLAAFCRRVIELQDLFLAADDAGSEEQGARAAVVAAGFVRSWWKFQYLPEVLESSLADIKWMWMEGELALEFGRDEIVDLIEALFADSDHRRKAIAEIRRSRKGV